MTDEKNRPATLGDIEASEHKLIEAITTMNDGLTHAMTTMHDGLTRAITTMNDGLTHTMTTMHEGLSQSMATMHDGLVESMRVMHDGLIESMRGMQTEVLRGFESFSIGQNIRLRKLEADQSNLDTALSGRVRVLEERLLQIELKLGRI